MRHTLFWTIARIAGTPEGVPPDPKQVRFALDEIGKEAGETIDDIYQCQDVALLNEAIMIANRMAVRT